MEQVIREYGGFLLSGTAVVLLIAILFTGVEDNAGNKGAFAIIGAQIETDNTDYHSYTDFQDTYRTESGKTPPLIEYAGGSISVGTFRLPDYIKATDYDGRELEIKVVRILSPGNLEVDYDTAAKEAVLEEPGIYTVTVSALDDTNRSSECEIKIPVNK